MTFRHLLLLLAGVAVGAAATAWWLRHPVPDEEFDPNWMPMVRVVAGTGRAEMRDGDVLHASFADPFGVAVAQDRTIFIADGVASNRIRAVDLHGVVRTIAGRDPGFADGSGPSAQFRTPSGLAIDASGTLYVADTGNNAIRRVTREGVVTTIAGDDMAGYRDGPATEALFNGPIGIAVDPSGRLVIADTYNDRIRVITSDGAVATVAGSDRGFADGVAPTARFDTPSGVAVANDGTIFVADTGNDAIRRIATNGTVSTLALPIRIEEPVGVAIDPRGVVYATDLAGRVIEITGGSARVLAGAEPGFRDGVGADARFRRPVGIAAIEAGELIVADSGNALVRSLALPSAAIAMLPRSPLISPTFNLETFRWQPLLWPLEPLEGPFEIAGTMGEARGADAERFHSGVDVRADQGTRVVTVREGLVQSPVSTGAFGTLNEWVRIGPITYVHLRVGRTREGSVFDHTRFVVTRDGRGEITGMRVKRGAAFLTGERIGTVNQFSHVHLNVGWPGEEYNPLLFNLVQFTDTVPPTIAPGGIRFFDANGQPLRRREKGRVILSGPVQVVVDAWDQADGNRPSRRLGLYSLGYQVLRPDGVPIAGFERPLETMRFDRMPADASAPSLVFAPGSGIPFYGRRRTRFLYIVTNELRDGVAQQRFWDTATLPSGDYILRVHAADASGNQARAGRDVLVTIVAGEN